MPLRKVSQAPPTATCGQSSRQLNAVKKRSGGHKKLKGAPSLVPGWQESACAHWLKSADSTISERNSFFEVRVARFGDSVVVNSECWWRCSLSSPQSLLHGVRSAATPAIDPSSQGGLIFPPLDGAGAISSAEEKTDSSAKGIVPEGHTLLAVCTWHTCYLSSK